MKFQKVIMSALFGLSLGLLVPAFAQDAGVSSVRDGSPDDGGMGRDVRAEASLQYLRARYGDDPSKWPCDQKVDLGAPVNQIHEGPAPAGSDAARAEENMQEKN